MTIVDAVNKIIRLPADQESILREIVRLQQVPKGSYFIHAGDVPTKFGFVRRGLFRYVYTSATGNEFTKGFFPEHSFLSSYTAMSTSSSSHFGIQALEDAEIDVVDYPSWLKMYKGHTCWSSVLVALLEKGYIRKEARERELLLLSAEERYRIFLREYPDLPRRVKQHLIASYLGITPVALSRIRKNFTNIEALT